MAKPHAIHATTLLVPNVSDAIKTTVWDVPSPLERPCRQIEELAYFLFVMCLTVFNVMEEDPAAIAVRVVTPFRHLLTAW